jgi:hypothetical protein
MDTDFRLYAWSGDTAGHNHGEANWLRCCTVLVHSAPRLITMALPPLSGNARAGTQVGVNLPAHFMIRPMVGDMELLVDVFNNVREPCLHPTPSCV